MRLGLAIGTFDMFHYGHANFLKRCKEDCDQLVVAVNTDEFATRYKREPIMNLAERILMVGQNMHVDHVEINDGCEDSKVVIMRVQPSVLYHGDDWTGAALLNQLGITEEWMELCGLDLKYIPYTGGISTTDVIDRVLKWFWKPMQGMGMRLHD